MHKSRADAVVQAILESDPEQQQERERTRANEARRLAEYRKVAWLGLAGFAIGAIIAVYADQRFVVGGLWGGFSGIGLGQLWIGVRRRRMSPGQTTS